MVELTSIQGNGQWLDGGSMFGNAPRALWERWTEVDDKGRIPLSCRCLLAKINGKNVLFETGIGAFFEPKMADRFGVQNKDRHMLLENLKAKGLSPEDIDYVILSHLHFDHAGGLLPTHQDLEAGASGLSFPRATIIVGEEAWQRSLSPHPRDKASFLPELNKRLKESGRLHIIGLGEHPPQELQGHLGFFYSHGHTPGQMHAIIFGQGQNKVVFAGDLIPGSAWVHLPITMGYDRYPEKLIDEKTELYERFIDQNLQVFFTHDPKWALGRIQKNEKGHFEATDLVAQLDGLSLQS